MAGFEVTTEAVVLSRRQQPGCGRAVNNFAHTYEREVRDLPDHCRGGTVPVAEPRLRPKVEKVQHLPSKAPFSKRFEDVVGLACESAAMSGLHAR